MPVGTFPGLKDLNRRTIRGPVNPLDKSTIVSIFPKKIRVIKVTLLPGQWTIEPGSIENPALLVVGPSSWFKELELNEPLLEIPQSSIQIADSIIKDYCNGIPGCDMGNSMPGIFFVPGEHNITAIRSNYKPLLEKAVNSQTNYYRTMIKFADHLWAVSSGNPMVINDEMRMAAKVLGLQDKDWMKDHQMVGMVRCHACGSLKNPGYPVCATCSAIDVNHALAASLKFADKPGG